MVCFIFKSVVPNLPFSSPLRIVHDTGGAYAMGSIAGSLFHFAKGFKEAAKVCVYDFVNFTSILLIFVDTTYAQRLQERIIKGATNRRTIRSMGRCVSIYYIMNLYFILLVIVFYYFMNFVFPFITGMFSTIDCTLIAIRKKEDSANAIIAGGVTGSLLTMRQGWQSMAISGVIGMFVCACVCVYVCVCGRIRYLNCYFRRRITWHDRRCRCDDDAVYSSTIRPMFVTFMIQFLIFYFLQFQQRFHHNLTTCHHRHRR
jgi:hypothetical protein